MKLLHQPAGKSRGKILFFLTTLASLASALSFGAAPVASFVTEEPEDPVASSHFTLEWTAEADGDGPVTFELRQSSELDFAEYRVRYEGQDRASFLAGLPEGDHYFQVRASTPGNGSEGPWSDPFQLTIEYQSLTLAWLLFGVGAVVFLATLGLVVAGSAKARREEETEAAGRGPA